MSKPEKLSDRALNNAIKTNWQELLSATQLRGVVQKGFLVFGLLGAAALPLLGTDPNTPPQIVAGKDGTDGRDGTDGEDGEDGEDATVSDGPRVTVPSIKVLSKIEIRAAVASKIWHRSTFDSVGDEFWALPDSNFKLTLTPPLTEKCNKAICNANFEATFEQFDKSLPNSPYKIQLLTEDRAIRLLTKPEHNPKISQVCKVIDDPTPYLLCRLESDLDTPNSDVCLWLRRATKGESDNETVAVEIRWEKVTLPFDRYCGGEFLRDEY